MTLDHPDEEATDPEEGIKTILNFRTTIPLLFRTGAIARKNLFFLLPTSH